MSLKNRLLQSVDRAFNALDDLVGDMTITSISNDSYDPNTGVVSQTSTPYVVTAVFDTYETDRVDGTIIQAEDRLILVKPVNTFIPKIGDTIEGPSGIVYNIMDFNDVRAYDQSFLWELQARK
jgi:hypothetical protein